jgi:ABC-2 type transport system permease protein
MRRAIGRSDRVRSGYGGSANSYTQAGGRPLRSVRKYLAFLGMGAAQARRRRAELYGRLVFMAVILGVFSALWNAVAEAGIPLALDRAQLVWYLAVTEWITLTPHAVHVDIEGEIRRGDVACHLQRPFSYLGALLAEGAGTILVRAPFMALAAAACAAVLTGRAPDAHMIAAVVPIGLAAMLLVHGIYVLIGLLAFWIDDVTPVFWISQKLLFIFGGLMLPLAFYPVWMQRLAALTPFPPMLSGPAGLLLGGETADVWLLVRNLVLWTAVLGLAAAGLFRRAVRNPQVNGG